MRIEQKSPSTPPASWSGSTSPSPPTTPSSSTGSPAGRSPATGTAGLGARYRMLIRVGAADVGGLIEIVEWQPEGDMAWTSVTGIDQRGRWRLRDLGDGRTRVTFRFAYGVAGGGIAGLIAERVAALSLQPPLPPLAAQPEARGRGARRASSVRGGPGAVAVGPQPAAAPPARRVPPRLGRGGAWSASPARRALLDVGGLHDSLLGLPLRAWSPPRSEPPPPRPVPAPRPRARPARRACAARSSDSAVAPDRAASRTRSSISRRAARPRPPRPPPPRPAPRRRSPAARPRLPERGSRTLLSARARPRPPSSRHAASALQRPP